MCGKENHVHREVRSVIRTALKGAAHDVIAKAERQAQEEADALYMLILNANISVIESQAYVGLFKGLLSLLILAEAQGLDLARIPDLCGRTLLRFAEETLLIEPVLNRISRECLNGHPVLIPEAAGILEDQLEALKTFCAEFNRIAEGRQECAIILRDSLRSQACAAVLPS